MVVTPELNPGSRAGHGPRVTHLCGEDLLVLATSSGCEIAVTLLPFAIAAALPCGPFKGTGISCAQFLALSGGLFSLQLPLHLPTEDTGAAAAAAGATASSKTAAFSLAASTVLDLDAAV